MMGKQTEGIGISLKVNQVLPLAMVQTVTGILTDITLQETTLALAEVRSNGLLATVSERGITQVMCQTSSADDATQLRQMCLSQFGMALQEQTAYVITQATSHTAHLQTVCQTVMNKDTARKGKYLRLILQTPEWGRENQAVIITLKFRSVIPTVRHTLLPQPFIGKQPIPVHHHHLRFSH
jgi:hypothetical protein